MQAFGVAASPDRGGTSAGLVLLYAPGYTNFQPAYLLQERELTIGRETTNSICINEPAVSRQHAKVHYQDGHWTITDLGGRNGTIVDGEYVEKEVALEHLHEIRVGDAIFKFVAAGAESYARYRIDGVILGAPPGEAYDPSRRGAIVGGYQIATLASALRRVAPTQLSIIFFGESGTGKEVFAKQLHDWSGRKGAFQAVNCAAIPQNLLESELFGYKRGAFSGADRDKIGIVRAADGGTLFLDEIGDMPLEAQAKLLRVIQSKEVVPLGATVAERVDVRIICATHRDLMRLQKAGTFRGDLYARLNEYNMVLPPLRERKEDIYALCRSFLERHGSGELGMTFPFMTGLLHYDYPYNVRELEAFIKRGCALCDGGELDTAHLPDEIKEQMKHYAQRRAPGAPAPVAAPVAGAGAAAGVHAPPIDERPTPTEEELRSLLAIHKGNLAAVAREFGKQRMQVHRWLKKLGIEPDQYR
jgi:DNA-binding NtrC family response regulator